MPDLQVTTAVLKNVSSCDGDEVDDTNDANYVVNIVAGGGGGGSDGFDEDNDCGDDANVDVGDNIDDVAVDIVFVYGDDDGDVDESQAKDHNNGDHGCVFVVGGDDDDDDGDDDDDETCI